MSEWIPASEQLPEKSGMYIVTRGDDAFEEDGKATWAIFDPAKKKFYYPGGRVKYYINVLAWMPLPEPYREVE